MDSASIVVLVGGIVAVIFVLWYFFGPSGPAKA